GQIVTFTATVTSAAAGTPTGTVTFKDAANSLGTVTLNASAQAVLTTSSLTIGAHNMKAIYGGDATYAGGSGTVRQTVQASSTTTTLSSSLNPSLVGQAVTFTAQVTSSSGGIPTATVTFKESGKTLGTGTLNAS